MKKRKTKIIGFYGGPGIDYIVTEKPVLLDLVYCRLYQPECIIQAVEQTVAAHYTHVASLGHTHISVLFRRTGGYDNAGRFENRRQAELVDRVAEQALGEFACSGQSVYSINRNQIPQFLSSLL